jgi:hypothetical protein
MSPTGRLAAAFAAVALVCSCGEAADDAAHDSAGSTTAAGTSAAATTGPLQVSPLTVVADHEETTVPSSPDLEPSLQRLVDQAADDLATRLSIDRSTIETVSAQYVTWPDKGLGCPQPGMVYLQVTVDGALIELAVDGTTYSYHSGGTKAPFLCQKT